MYWQDAACRLVIPLPQMAPAQLYKYHDQSGEQQACLKAALTLSHFETGRDIFYVRQT